MALARTWDDLAKALSNSLDISVTRRSLQNWRKDPRYTDYPRPIGDRHDVSAWRAFMISNGLNRADEVVPVGSSSRSDFHGAGHPWNARRNFLFDILEFLHSAYYDGRIDLEQYSKAGAMTVNSIIKIGQAWHAEIDAAGFRRTWRACLADAALRKNEENKRDRD